MALSLRQAYATGRINQVVCVSNDSAIRYSLRGCLFSFLKKKKIASESFTRRLVAFQRENIIIPVSENRTYEIVPLLSDRTYITRILIKGRQPRARNDSDSSAGLSFFLDSFSLRFKLFRFSLVYRLV